MIFDVTVINTCSQFILAYGEFSRLVFNQPLNLPFGDLRLSLTSFPLRTSVIWTKALIGNQQLISSSDFVLERSCFN